MAVMLFDQCGHYVSTTGLILDIVGAVLIFFYGLPEALSRGGHKPLTLAEVDEAEAMRAKQYDCRARIGLALLIAGFVLQLVGMWLGR